MSFKYINPGYANLLDVDGGITIADATRSKTGVGFYQPTAYKGINISATPTDLYGKFDVYVYRDSDDKSADNFEIQISLGLNGVSFKKATNNFYLSGLVNNNSQIYLNASTWYPDTLKSKLNITMNAINTISFHAHACTDSSAKDGYLILYANGKEVGRAENYAVNFSYTNPNVVVVYGTNSTGLISNLIISDIEINKREQVVILPIDTTETTMTAGSDGKYTASAAGQQILQSIDVASLIADYGADSQIKGIAVIGNPAYRTAEGLSMLTALEQVNGTVTEYGAKEVASSSTAGVIDSRAVNLNLANLANYKFGWKAGVGQ